MPTLLSFYLGVFCLWYLLSNRIRINLPLLHISLNFGWILFVISLLLLVPLLLIDLYTFFTLTNIILTSNKITRQVSFIPKLISFTQEQASILYRILMKIKLLKIFKRACHFIKSYWPILPLLIFLPYFYFFSFYQIVTPSKTNKYCIAFQCFDELIIFHEMNFIVKLNFEFSSIAAQLVNWKSPPIIMTKMKSIKQFLGFPFPKLTILKKTFSYYHLDFALLIILHFYYYTFLNNQYSFLKMIQKLFLCEMRKKVSQSNISQAQQYNKLNQNYHMHFVKILRWIKTGLPIFKSVFKAYKDTTGGSGKTDNSFFSQYFSKVMGQNNLGAPVLTESVALQILNIEKNIEEVEPRMVLQRYYTLFKKNDPKIGGTTYLQSKVYAAKQALMARYPDAADHQQLFYKEVVEPEEKAEEQAKRAAQAQKQKKKQQKVQEDKKKQ